MTARGPARHPRREGRPDVEVAPASEADLPPTLALNNAAVPAMNTLDRRELDALCAMGELHVARVDGRVAGALLSMAAGQPYDSLNYRWFVERFAAFLYVDRVVVDPSARGLGLGRALYEDLFARAAARAVPRVCAEVNVDPPNPGSMAFHETMGFRALAERLNPREGKTVAMLERPIAVA